MGSKFFGSEFSGRKLGQQNFWEGIFASKIPFWEKLLGSKNVLEKKDMGSKNVWEQIFESKKFLGGKIGEQSLKRKMF